MKSTLRFAALAAAVASGPVLAQPAIAVSEPSVLGLLAIGVVAAVVVWARNRRK